MVLVTNMALIGPPLQMIKAVCALKILNNHFRKESYLNSFECSIFNKHTEWLNMSKVNIWICLFKLNSQETKNYSDQDDF